MGQTTRLINTLYSFILLFDLSICLSQVPAYAGPLLVLALHTHFCISLFIKYTSIISVKKREKKQKVQVTSCPTHQGVRKSQILRSAFVFTFLWFLENHIKDHPPSLYKYYIHHALNFVNLHCFYHGARNLIFFIHILILILIQPNMELRCLCQFLWQRYPPQIY